MFAVAGTVCHVLCQEFGAPAGRLRWGVDLVRGIQAVQGRYEGRGPARVGARLSSVVQIVVLIYDP